MYLTVMLSIFKFTLSSKMSGVIERIIEIPVLTVGEGPHWDVKTQSLYLVDVVGHSVHKYVPSTGQHFYLALQKQSSFIIPVKNSLNQFVITQDNEISLLTWDGDFSKIEKLVDVLEEDGSTNNKLNDGKCDSTGRLWTGTVGLAGSSIEEMAFNTTAGFYSLYKGQLKRHLTNVGLSNGLAWNDPLNKFYHVDSWAGTISEFDFDAQTETISNKRIVFTTEPKNLTGAADGMTIDVEGNLWVALVGAGKIVQINPQQPEKVQKSIELPTKLVTSLAWGGPGLDILYVTSANLPIGGIPPNPPVDGSVYTITGLGSKGFPANDFVL